MFYLTRTPPPLTDPERDRLQAEIGRLEVRVRALAEALERLQVARRRPPGQA